MVIIVVIIELIAACGIAVMEKADHDTVSKELSIIGRVNTDGSGIYLAEDLNADDFISIDSEGNVKFNAESWGGKVFGTPGASTIQHIQLMTIVQNDMGLKFEKYDNGSALSDDTVYFVDTITNYTHAVNNAEILSGGILWEPQYHYILTSEYYKQMVTTNVLFPGHTCCTIAGYQKFLDNNESETVRFLAAYIEAVDYINDAKADPSGEKYQKLLAICKDNIVGLTDDVIKQALDTVEYKYSDTAGTSELSGLKDDIAALADDLYGLGVAKYSTYDLGFDSSEDFADAFIDSSYLSEALKTDSYSGSRSTITIAAIDGDIHQIAVQVAKSLGYFDKYGLDVTIKPLPNGGSVAQDLISGQSDIGFVGAPPITSATINGQKIIDKEDE